MLCLPEQLCAAQRLSLGQGHLPDVNTKEKEQELLKEGRLISERPSSLTQHSRVLL